MPTIALVDDDENILTSLKIFFEAEGYAVRTYTDGAAALTALAETPPDIAILDIKMPRMDGVEVLRRLRQGSNLPVILLTSKDEEMDEVVGFNVGADDYIKKPFSQRLLNERVKALLRRTRALTGAPGGESNDKKPIVRGELTLRAARGGLAFRTGDDESSGLYIELTPGSRAVTLQRWGTRNRDMGAARGLTYDVLQRAELHAPIDSTEPFAFTLLNVGPYVEFSVNDEVVLATMIGDPVEGGCGVWVEGPTSSSSIPRFPPSRWPS